MALSEAAHIFQRLRNGTVPDRGVDAFAVGIERHRKELQRKIAEVKAGEGDVKFLRGGYGCGKTFMANLLVHDAQQEGFVTSFVVVSDNDLHFHKFDELYRKVVSELRTPACAKGALGDILDRWIGGIEEGLAEIGVADDDPAFDGKVLNKLDEHLAATDAPPDMARVIRKIFELKQGRKFQEANALVSWLSGSPNVAASVKSLAGIKGDIASSDSLNYLRGILAIIQKAGYRGLVIVIDEAETILRMRGDVRGKSLNAIRQIVDASGSYHGLLWVFTGTPTFFDDRHGVKGVEALYARIRYEELNGIPSLRQPQLALKPFDSERLLKVALKLRAMHPELSEADAERRFPRELVEQLVAKVTEGFHGDVGVVPRQFLRTFVGVLDTLADDSEQDARALLGFAPDPASLTAEEEAVLAGSEARRAPALRRRLRWCRGRYVMTVFSRFPERLQHAIANLGFDSLRPVQELAGEAILDGKNAVVLAPTAGGKTEASMFPVIAGLMTTPPSGVGALYVAPIKALLNNQEVRLGTYTEMVGLQRFVWHGDALASQKNAFMREPAELLMTTPESLEVMLMSPRVPAAKLFADLRWVVIDEIHAFAGTDRGAHLMSVLERLATLSKHDVQRIGLSATVGNPERIAAWLGGSSKRECVVVDPPKPKAKRLIKVYLREDTSEFAREAARDGKGKKSLFFCQSRALTEAIAEEMRGDEIDVFVHHGSVSKEERYAAEERFATGTNACIVATSTLELGIDVGGLDLTFQANAPSTVSSFLQRMGRTGRRPGTDANMTFLCEDAVSVVQATALVRLAARGWVERIPEQTRCWPVLVHQILAMTQQHGGISAERCWQMLSRIPDFAGISVTEYEDLISHMKRGEWLFESGGLLVMGRAAEKAFGKKNFLELYAVFSTPVLYAVETESARPVGSLEQAFVDRLVDDMSTFLLGGRPWLVLRVNHDDRVVRVQPAPRGKKPSWGGFIPQFLGREVCEEMRAVLMGSDEHPFLDERAKTSLAEWRAELGPTLGRGAMLFDGDTLVWWTFAGGRINQTLKYALEWKGSWKVSSDNFSLSIQGAGVGFREVGRVVAELGSPGAWEDADLRRALLSKVPDYRLSKFQKVLPDPIQVEMVGAYLLDFAGASSVTLTGPLVSVEG